ncbi:MAG: hypothetical protein JNK15_14245 [Planctomycetes bacterium]|nr:hypothetical protein [Planctomycetota bacterium]
MHGLAKDYTGKVDCKVVKHDEGDSQDRIKRYGLDIHGMVVTDAADKVLWSESGHKQTRDGIDAALKKLLGS